MSAPNPYTRCDALTRLEVMESEENAREWWHWHFAGMVWAARLSGGWVPDPQNISLEAERAVMLADALIDALEAKR